MGRKAFLIKIITEVGEQSTLLILLVYPSNRPSDWDFQVTIYAAKTGLICGIVE